MSFFLSLSNGDEFKICLRCRANLRYEMLAEYLRANCLNISDMAVLELDPDSPLRPFLSQARQYVRTYFSQKHRSGSIRSDGARCEDITRLSLPDNSVDLIVSSDVLEHVADLAAAFKETTRVLRPGGKHIFTVPSAVKTRRKAGEIHGVIQYFDKPEFHNDPLNPEGILVYWDIGPDAISVFGTEKLKVSIVDGPKGADRRLVWKAEKLNAANPLTTSPS